MPGGRLRPAPARVDRGRPTAPRLLRTVRGFGYRLGPWLKYRCPPVVLSAGHEAAHLVVTVSDRGPGIAAEALPHLFERFYKADAARARSDGSGLGLAIARENARLHGGDLQVANRPGGGAAFRLTLPASGRLRVPEHGVRPVREAGPSPVDSSGRT